MMKKNMEIKCVLAAVLLALPMACRGGKEQPSVRHRVPRTYHPVRVTVANDTEQSRLVSISPYPAIGFDEEENEKEYLFSEEYYQSVGGQCFGEPRLVSLTEIEPNGQLEFVALPERPLNGKGYENYELTFPLLTPFPDDPVVNRRIAMAESEYRPRFSLYVPDTDRTSVPCEEYGKMPKEVLRGRLESGRVVFRMSDLQGEFR